MSKVRCLSAALVAAATFATPALAAKVTSRHVPTGHYARAASDMRPEVDTCVRAPRVGAFATQPWTDAAPCEPNTAY
jgi:hypothetical protein